MPALRRLLGWELLVGIDVEDGLHCEAASAAGVGLIPLLLSTLALAGGTVIPRAGQRASTAIMDDPGETPEQLRRGFAP
jgi:hypothetical protein